MGENFDRKPGHPYDLGFLLSLAAGLVAVTAALAAFLQLAKL
jgi:hypothetical protein